MQDITHFLLIVEIGIAKWKKCQHQMYGFYYFSSKIYFLPRIDSISIFISVISLENVQSFPGIFNNYCKIFNFKTGLKDIQLENTRNFQDLLKILFVLILLCQFKHVLRVLFAFSEPNMINLQSQLTKWQGVVS